LRQLLQEIVELLVSAGAEVNCRDKELMTPLHAAAAATGSFAVVATLLELGADLGARNAAGNTPAHTAALNGHVEAMEEFLSSGYNLKTTNGRGQTVLHLAAVATKVPFLAGFWIWVRLGSGISESLDLDPDPHFDQDPRSFFLKSFH